MRPRGLPSPYPSGETALRAVGSRPASEAPPPLQAHDTDHDELAGDEPTDPETPMAIDDRLRQIDVRLARLERGQQSFLTEIQRHQAVERAARVTHGALPWAAILVALAALGVSVYRLGEPVVVQLQQPPIPVLFR